MQKTLATTIAAAAVVSAQIAGSRYSPMPSHPRTATWYAALRKPSFTPPGAVFAIAWTALDTSTLTGYDPD